MVKALAVFSAQQRPDWVVLSRSVRGPAQFRSAKAFVDRLGAPVLAIPGNHDVALQFGVCVRRTGLRWAEVPRYSARS